MGSLRDREVACSASNHQPGSKFKSYIWRAVSSHSSHHPQEVILAQFSLYEHKPHSFHFSTLYIIINDIDFIIISKYFFGCVRMTNMILYNRQREKYYEYHCIV